MSTCTTSTTDVEFVDDWKADLREFLGADPLEGVAVYASSGIGEHVVIKARNSSRRRRSSRDPERKRRDRKSGKRPGLDKVAHGLLMDKGIIPLAYQEFELTRAERHRIRDIQSGRRRTRNVPAPSRKDLRNYRNAMRTVQAA